MAPELHSSRNKPVVILDDWALNTEISLRMPVVCMQCQRCGEFAMMRRRAEGNEEWPLYLGACRGCRTLYVQRVVEEKPAGE